MLVRPSGGHATAEEVWHVRKLALILGAALAFGLPAPAWAAPSPPTTTSPSAVLVEASTGQVLFAKNPDEVRAPASMTKVMTLHLALQAIRQHKAQRGDPVSVSARAYHTSGSQIWLEPGETLPLGQLLRAVAIGSANDACVAIGEHLAGSEDAFVAQMNREAKRLGMTRTHYVNSHGLDVAGHVTSALDMTRLARAAINDPGLLALTSQRQDRTIRDGKGGRLWLVNTNRLLGPVPGVDGLKTGYTSHAGYCLAATAKREGLRLIAVVMGAPSSRTRFGDARSLLAYGFSNYRAVLLAKGGQSVGRVSVLHGTRGSVSATVQHDVSAVQARLGSPSVELRALLRHAVAAPVRRGQVIGRAEIVLGGKRVTEVPLVARDAVGRQTFMLLLRQIVQGVLRI